MLPVAASHTRIDLSKPPPTIQQFDELAQLLSGRDEPTSVWRYAQALLAFRQSGIAGPEAYPAVMRMEPYESPASPTSEDLIFLEGCLQVIPDFVTSNEDAKSYEVNIHGKAFKMRLKWRYPG